MMTIQAGLVILWWLPTLGLILVRFGWRRLTFRVRFYWARLLRLTGHFDAALRVLDRLNADVVKVTRRPPR